MPRKRWPLHIVALLAMAYQTYAFSLLHAGAQPRHRRRTSSTGGTLRRNVCEHAVSAQLHSAECGRRSCGPKLAEIEVDPRLCSTVQNSFGVWMQRAVYALGSQLLPMSAAASDGSEDKRLLYTAVYTVAHLPIIVPFLLFWKVDKETKIKGAAVATPFFIAWIALLGGWLRY